MVWPNVITSYSIHYTKLYENRIGILGENAGIDDVLSVRVEQQLDRRLQSQVYRRGFARSPKQARQFITHGHISINGRRVTIPGYTVSAAEQEQISRITSYNVCYTKLLR